jgi:uncharacterized protein
MKIDETTAIAQTQNWIKSVVIDCNFCPFAAKALLKQSIRYVVLESENIAKILESLLDEFTFLDENEEIETTFIIFPHHFKEFEQYLDLVELAEDLNVEEDYEGIYQIASFHPEYCFAGADAEDAANYTNRSVYPMLHILREDSITKALEHFQDAAGIPERNITYAQEKGVKYMAALRAACLK